MAQALDLAATAKAGDTRSPVVASRRDVVVADHLTKRFGDVVAVDDLSFRLEAGTVTGFLGPNGAGKTTTLRMLLGLVRPTAGTALVFGHGYRDHPGPARRVGAVLEAADFHPGRSGREHLLTLALAAGLPNSRVDEVLDVVTLTGAGGRRVKTYSLGMRQRLGLAAALLRDPELLILDEPANGLDPAGVSEVRELLRELAQRRGATVFISSHILAEVDRLATRIGIIHRGRLIEELDDEALERHRDVRLEIGAREPAAAEAALRQAGFLPGRRDAQGAFLELREPRAIAAPDEIARILVEAGSPPTHLALARETLEDHFMRVTAQTGVVTESPATTSRAGVPT
jgi:ABC-2 type transport system ATP-binding protein